MLRRALVVLATALALVALSLTVSPAAAQAKARPPVVVIVLDEFPVGDLMLPNGKLDTRRFPGFAALARGSTWFRNATTVHDSTQEAVPAILTGQLPEAGVTSTYRAHPDSIFDFMHRLGYRLHVREEATTVCKPSLCPRTDHYGNPDYDIRYDRRERLNATIARLKASATPTFTLHHSILPHVPWVYLPSGQARTGYKPGTLPNFTTGSGFRDPFLTLFDQQSHLLQVGFVDREIGKLVKRLKRTGQWRKALVVVTADHGISFQNQFAGLVVDRRAVSQENVQDIAPVPLFIKRPNQVRGSVSRVWASTVDIVPTIAHLLGRGLGYPADGAQVYGSTVRGRRDVTIFRRKFDGSLVESGTYLNQLRSLTAGIRAAIFGTGSWSAVYRIGPNRGLLGKVVSQVPRGADNGSRALFDVPSGLDRVNPRASRVPTMAGGRIVTGARTNARDIALAVNGRVAAVGQTVHLERDTHEYFALNVPVSALRRGRNVMELYEVVGRTLVALGNKH